MAWNALYTAAKQELATRDKLVQVGVTVCCPFERVNHRFKVRGLNKYILKSVDNPLYPRYIFSDAADQTLIRKARAPVDFVRSGGLPVEIPDIALKFLFGLMDEDGCVSRTTIPLYNVQGKVGDNFQFSEKSPFQGLLGRISSLSDLDETGHLKAWLSIFGAEREVRIPAAHVGQVVPKAA